ncbi:MAG: patatin-like phospholipase family protein [Acidobacteria bacterium]|nr:patatin-like phospholipase family protein [Acidobacteriota bacterium]
MNLIQKLKADGPKRILALDGGGIRGALTIGYLEKIENILRLRYNNPNLRLCDYFDLIGGTSTGSIIAAALAIGKEVSEIKELYLRLGEKVFTKNKRWWTRVWRATFSETQLKAELESLFGDLTFGHNEGHPPVQSGDSSIKTGLCIVTKRADTGSTWPIINHPDGTFFSDNRGMLLRGVIRASTAAPTYFESEKLEVGEGQVGVFVDGGVSMANNPALQLFLIATLKGFPFHWPTGEEKLLLVSIGTGTWKPIVGVDTVTGASKLSWAERVPSILMNDANAQNQLLLQYLSKTLTPWKIDGEVGNLSDDLLTPEPALTYLRYNARLETNPLQTLGLGSLVTKLDSLRKMEVGGNCQDLITIGERAAQCDVVPEHFPSVFDVAGESDHP